jgi:very-short-patch-repair endonuclease
MIKWFLFKNCNTNVLIICPKHGEFKQNPKHHYNGVGCPICKESKGEKTIRKYLLENSIKFENQKEFQGCKYEHPLKFDFYLPEHNICIEFDGEQHFKIVEKWGGLESYNKVLIRDKIKDEYCIENNIHLLRIRFDENINDKLTDLKNFFS